MSDDRKPRQWRIEAVSVDDTTPTLPRKAVEKDGKPKQSFRDIMRESYADAMNMIGNSREVHGRSRQVVVVAMLGVALSFLIALLAVQHLDRALTFATIAIGAAIPLLT